MTLLTSKRSAHLRNCVSHNFQSNDLLIVYLQMGRQRILIQIIQQACNFCRSSIGFSCFESEFSVKSFFHSSQSFAILDHSSLKICGSASHQCNLFRIFFKDILKFFGHHFRVTFMMLMDMTPSVSLSGRRFDETISFSLKQIAFLLMRMSKSQYSTRIFDVTQLRRDYMNSVFCQTWRIIFLAF